MRRLSVTYDKNPHASAARVTGLYDRHAQAFDRLRGKNLMERGWLDRFRAAMPSGAAVLDLGCGSGEPMARYLIENGHSLTGIDSAPAMLALCRARFPHQRWIEGDMRAVSLGGHFGGILAWGSFFHLPHQDQRAMLGVFRDHAAPGAALMFTSGPSHGEAIGVFEGEDLYHASLAPAEYRALLADNGFQVLSYVENDPTCGENTVWLAQKTV